MRYFFHLLGPRDQRIRDLEGVVAPSFAEAKRLAIAGIRQIRPETPAEETIGWDGWRLQISDVSGNVLGEIDLGRMVTRHVSSASIIGSGRLTPS